MLELPDRGTFQVAAHVRRFVAKFEFLTKEIIVEDLATLFKFVSKLLLPRTFVHLPELIHDFLSGVEIRSCEDCRF